jgi:sporulation protein YlmC with PRC-barrel domain
VARRKKPRSFCHAEGMAPIDDDGVAVHYTAVQRGTPVISSDGREVGEVVEVLDNYREHIFDGLIIQTSDGVPRFVDAPEVARTAERAVTLRITAAAVAELGPPQGGPGVTSSVKRLFGGLRRR